MQADGEAFPQWQRVAPIPRKESIMNLTKRARLPHRSMTWAFLLAPLVAFGLWLFSVPPAHAATIPVTASCTITEAITAANTDTPFGGCDTGSGQDTIVLTPTVYALTVADNSFGGFGDSGLPVITTTMTISGNGATLARDLSFSCLGGTDPEFRLFWVEPVGNLTLHDVTLRNGCADRGGGLYNDGGSVTVQGSAFYSNTASSDGGGLYNFGSTATMTISGQSEIYANTAITNGGGLANITGTVSVVNSDIYSNTGGFIGGGVYNTDGSMTVTGSNVYSNSALGGGGLANLTFNIGTGATMTITGQSEIYANTARDVGGTGGGLYNLGGTVSVLGSAVYSNAGGIFGGGVFNSGGPMIVSNSHIYANRAYQGGGLLNYLLGTLTLQDGEVYANAADGGGGGLGNLSGSVTVTGSAIYSNTGGPFGGGLVNSGLDIYPGTMTVKGASAVFANSAGEGGGLVNLGSAAMTISTQSEIYANTAITNGGGLYNITGTVTVANSSVYSNTTGDVGGGLYNDSGNVTVQASRINFNSANTDGGALYQEDGTISIIKSCIVGNRDTAVLYFGGTTPITATQNWWGSPSGPSGAGPGIGDSASSNVNFSAFQTSPILACPTLGPDLTLQKTATPDGTWLPGEVVTYTLLLKNEGERAAANVVLTDTLPSQVALSSVSADFTITQTSPAPTLAWQVADLPVGASGTVTLVVAITDTLAADVTITNTARILTPLETNISDNRASATHLVQLPRVNFASANYAATENGGPASITVNLDIANPYAGVTVHYGTGDGTATAGSDYTAVSNTLTISAGQTSAAFNVTLSGDSTVEAGETVSLTLSNPTHAVLASPDSAVLTIQNDDSTVITLSALDADNNEGNSGSTVFTFRATLDNPLQGGFDLAYATNDGTATTADNDYTANDASLTFAGTAGEQHDIAVQVIGDTTVEPDETFSITLGAISGLAAGIDSADVTTSGSPQSGVIRNDDEGPSEGKNVSIAPLDADKDEGDSGSTDFTFTITRENDVSAGLTVSYTVDGDVDGADFAGGSLPEGALVFTPNATLITLTFTVQGDVTVEADETFTVTLTDTSDDTQIATPSAQGVIRNDDKVLYLPLIIKE